MRKTYGVSETSRLASNHSAFAASPAVTLALCGLAADVGLYPDANCTALRAAIASRIDILHAQLMFGNGPESILQMICQAFHSPGDRVLVQRPALGLHAITPRTMGAAGKRC